MKASNVIIQCLKEQNVTTLFGYPGGAVLPIYEALRTSDIKHILVRHEQSAAHSASGYARAHKTVGVCLATSGPGATNLITGIATAYMDSIPLIILTGQVKSTCIGKDVFQEADITGATEPFTKHNYLVQNAKDLPRIIKEAFYIASTGRPGPVLIDIPVDLQNEEISTSTPQTIHIPGYKPTYEGHSGQIKRALQKLKDSRKPLICAGGGILCANASEELTTFANQAKIPVVHTLMGLGAMSCDSPYYVGMVGSHGHTFSNKIVSESDLLMIVGARVGDRATAHMDLIDPDKNIIHIDIDPAEVGKNVDTSIPIVGDAKNILSRLIKKCRPLDTDEWLKRIEHLKNIPSKESSSRLIDPENALQMLSSLCDDQTIVTADVGQNQIWTARNFKIYGNRKFLTSGGLGTMGYSLPASIGAKLACDDQTVVCIVGDGGIQMSLSELGTLSEYDLNIIIILFNNNRLGMVRELQDNHYGKGKYFGIDFKKKPDFVKIAQAYGLDAESVSNQDQLEQVFKKALHSHKGYLIECMVDKDQSTL